MRLALTFASSFTILTITSPFLSVLIRNLGYGPRMIGLLLGASEVAGLVGPFLTGWLVDRLGRFRPVLALSYAFILVAAGMIALFRHPAAVLLALVLLSVGFKSMIPLVDTAATIALGRGGNYGKARSLGSLSFVAMAVFLQYQPWMPVGSPSSILFWLAATTVFAFCFLPAFPNPDLRGRKPSAAHGGKEKAPHSFVDGPFVVGVLIIAFSRLAMTPVNAFFSLYLLEEIRWNAVSLMWALSAAVEIPVMFFSSRLIARFGAPFLLAVSTGAVFVRLVVYALFPNPAGVVFAQLLHSLCYGLFHPAAVGFIATRVPPERRATGMAIYLSLGSGLPNFLGSSVGGFVIDSAGYRPFFLIYSLFAVASVALYWKSRRALEAPTRAW